MFRRRIPGLALAASTLLLALLCAASLLSEPAERWSEIDLSILAD